ERPQGHHHGARQRRQHASPRARPDSAGCGVMSAVGNYLSSSFSIYAYACDMRGTGWTACCFFVLFFRSFLLFFCYVPHVLFWPAIVLIRQWLQILRGSGIMAWP
ncbi:unnamed protein product, partial [Ectocarpus sp. 13 AM-2016]